MRQGISDSAKKSHPSVNLTSSYTAFPAIYQKRMVARTGFLESQLPPLLGKHAKSEWPRARPEFVQATPVSRLAHICLDDNGPRGVRSVEHSVQYQSRRDNERI